MRNCLFTIDAKINDIMIDPTPQKNKRMGNYRIKVFQKAGLSNCHNQWCHSLCFSAKFSVFTFYLVLILVLLIGLVFFSNSFGLYAAGILILAKPIV